MSQHHLVYTQENNIVFEEVFLRLLASDLISEVAILTVIRQGMNWHLDGQKNWRGGNQYGKNNLPHLPSAEWVSDQRLIAARCDLHGLVPLYYYYDKNRFGISSSWIALQQQFGLSTWDDTALACYFRLGHYLGDDTPFKGIKRLLPGATLTWKDGTLQIGDEPLARPKAATICRSKAIEYYGHIFEKSIAEICQETTLPRLHLISGGQDSRHILLAALAKNFRPDRCISQTLLMQGEKDDPTIATRLCKDFGLECEIIPPAISTIELELEKNWRILLESSNHAWLTPLAHRLDNEVHHLIFDGLGGDILSGSRFLTNEWKAYFQSRQWDRIASIYLSEEGYLPRLFTPEALDRWPRKIAHDRLSAEFEKTADWPNPDAAFLIRNRTRRSIAATLWPLFARNHDVALPYFHPDIYEFLISLPIEILSQRKFHQDTIETCYPHSAAIPFASGGSNPATKGFKWKISQTLAIFSLLRNSELEPIINSAQIKSRTILGLGSSRYMHGLKSIWSKVLYIAQIQELSETAKQRHLSQ